MVEKGRDEMFWRGCSAVTGEGRVGSVPSAIGPMFVDLKKLRLKVEVRCGAGML